MHDFTELINWCTNFTLEKLSEANEKTIEALQTSGATYLVKALQMIELQKTIFAVGMLSIFEANLQKGLNCKDGEKGFVKAKEILTKVGEIALRDSFSNYIFAINALKHGTGQSYDKLKTEGKTFPFRVKRPNETFFFEGDVSEVQTLIHVDDEFIQNCSEVICKVTEVIQREHPEYS